MNDQQDDIPLSDAMIDGTAGIWITADSKSPPQPGWRSARVTITEPELPAPVTFTVHWQEPSTCCAGCGKEEERIKEAPDDQSTEPSGKSRPM
jgi:hypothetical protein